MSSCGYYSCFKRKPECKHPTLGESYTQDLRRGGANYNPCDYCKRKYGGVYPSDIPKGSFDGCQIDVVDKQGNVLTNLSQGT